MIFFNNFFFTQRQLNLALKRKALFFFLSCQFSSKNIDNSVVNNNLGIIQNPLTANEKNKQEKIPQLLSTPVFTPRWKNQPIDFWPISNKKGGRRNRPKPTNRLLDPRPRGGLLNYTGVTPFISLNFPFSRDSARIIVTHIMEQFVDHLFFENWREYFRTHPSEITAEFIISQFRAAATFSWWTSLNAPKFLFKAKPVTGFNHNLETFTHSIIYFFINTISEHWFFSVHGRRLLTRRKYIETLGCFNTPLRTLKNYKVQHLEYLFNFIRRFNLNPYNTPLKNVFKTFRLVFFLQKLYQHQQFFRFFSTENLLKGLLVLLITKDYVRSKYYLFYPNKEEFACFLNKKTFMSTSDKDEQVEELYNFIINYLYLKIYNFIYSPDCTIFLVGPRLTVLSELTAEINADFISIKHAGFSWQSFLNCYLSTKRLFTDFYLKANENWEISLTPNVTEDLELFLNPGLQKLLKRNLQLQLQETNKFRYPDDYQVVPNMHSRYIEYIHGRLRVKSNAFKPQFTVDKNVWLDYQTQLERNFFDLNLTPNFNPLETFWINGTRINNVLAFSNLFNLTEAYTRHKKIKGFAGWFPKVIKSHFIIKYKFSPVRGWFHKMEWFEPTDPKIFHP